MIYTPDGQVIAEDQQESSGVWKRSYLATDANKTRLALFDETGTLKNQDILSPFGDWAFQNATLTPENLQSLTCMSIATLNLQAQSPTVITGKDTLTLTGQMAQQQSIIATGKTIRLTGEFHTKSATFKSTPPAPSVVCRDYRFTSKAQEPDLGLYYFQARWYDPQSARFISEDPAKPNLEDPIQQNPYLFCRNNPIKFIDQDGRVSVWVGGAGDKVNTDAYSTSITQKMKDMGINAKYVFTPRDEGGFAQAGRALRSGLNFGQERAVEYIKNSYDRSDGQFNLMGYSMGSIDAAYAALQLASQGKIIDNFILIGSPINDSGALMKQLVGQSNIRSITRYDIEGDPLAPNLDVFNLGNFNEHFYFTNNKFGQQDWLVKDVYDSGVR